MGQSATGHSLQVFGVAGPLHRDLRRCRLLPSADLAEQINQGLIRLPSLRRRQRDGMTKRPPSCSWRRSRVFRAFCWSSYDSRQSLKSVAVVTTSTPIL